MAASEEIIDTQTLIGDAATDGVDVSGGDANADTSATTASASTPVSNVGHSHSRGWLLTCFDPS